MGKAWSSVRRYARNFNAENRAQKAIEKREKQKVVAPRHQSTQNLLKNFSEEHPEYLNEQQRKNEKLLHNLKDLKVDSFGPPPEIRYTRPFPASRENPTTPEYGVQEPKIIPVGKVSIKQAIEIITNHRVSPTEHSSKTIAKQYKLQEPIVEQVLRHFQTLNMHIPKEVFQQDKTLLGKLKTLPLKKKVEELPKDSFYPLPSGKKSE
ncbi:NADH dehydrogenase [ubiquinone] 1 alpha subcomplex assembly factor 4 [Patella vulgata]|uniref:NADH dehydrogenase [ubiquinone] 1 alpha subcomplex assembly factor 4 n=1 Tax=Patella vulgata TaxID=6465 RepID=UPI0021801168|nr:NADH dehydrogenase [ubiquinone] 1 alpha subcomplex assembly factor 4 [Patella vulgata]